MVVLLTRDLRRSVELYRLLGLAMPEPRADRPVSLLRMASGVSLVLTSETFAERSDPTWVRPGEDAYRQLLEFVVDDDAAVDETWRRLTAAGAHGRKEPDTLTGIYAAMVDDPDGNVLLISSDQSARPTSGS